MNTVDDDLIRDLCSALDELTADISDTAPLPKSVGIATIVPGPRRRDRRRILVLAATIVALVGTVAALVAFRRDNRAVGSDDTALEVVPVITTGAPSIAIETPTTFDTLPLATDVVFAVGDSVMFDAASLLKARGITVGDSSDNASAAIEQLRQEKATSRISHGVVIQLGTDDPVTRQEYDSVLAEVSDVPRVVVLTVHGPDPWIANNNDIIRSLPLTHPNVVVLYWDDFATINADHLSSDGIHLGDDVSKDLYTNLILQVLGLPNSASQSPVHAEPGTYVLKARDFPADIAFKFRVSFEDLLSINGWTVVDGQIPQYPQPGTTIKIPAGWTEPSTDTDQAGTQPI